MAKVFFFLQNSWSFFFHLAAHSQIWLRCFSIRLMFLLCDIKVIPSIIMASNASLFWLAALALYLVFEMEKGYKGNSRNHF